jgi:hypothetical protein
MPPDAFCIREAISRRLSRPFMIRLLPRRQTFLPYLHSADRETTFDELVLTVLKLFIPEL